MEGLSTAARSCAGFSHARQRQPPTRRRKTSQCCRRRIPPVARNRSTRSRTEGTSWLLEPDRGRH
eukprot:3517722-Heterocapsa_arctica.AAC.1